MRKRPPGRRQPCQGEAPWVGPSSPRPTGRSNRSAPVWRIMLNPGKLFTKIEEYHQNQNFVKSSCFQKSGLFRVPLGQIFVIILPQKVDTKFPKDILKEIKLGQTMTSGHRPLTKIHRNWNQNISSEPKNITGTNKYQWSQQISPEPKNITRTKKYQWSQQVSVEPPNIKAKEKNHFGKFHLGGAKD